MRYEQLTVKVPRTEYALWQAEAKRRGMDDVGRWLRVLANFALAAEVEGARSASLGRTRRLAEVSMNCANCDRPLGYKRSARKRYCSDVCRATAWRTRQRHRVTRED